MRMGKSSPGMGVPLQDLCQATWHDRVYVDDILGVGLAKAVREAMEKIRLLWKTTPVEALSEQGELAFLGTWVSETLLGREYGFYIHQIPFAEQLVKRVSADGAMRRRETPCEP